MNDINEKLIEDIMYDCDLPLYLKDDYGKAISNKRSDWKNYQYQVYDNYLVSVPRVSEILDACIGKSYLQNWAASLGRRYETERLMTLNTGTYAHILIEDFLKYGSIRDNNKDYDKPYYRDQSLRSYSNFVTWWNNMIEQGFKIDILEIEKPVVCAFYGGTADIIAHIKDPNGLEGNYVLDFKTSKAITIDYFYQTVMYMDAINNDNSDLKIEGVGVIRCDKFKGVYEYLIVNRYKDPEFIVSLQIAVDHIINCYYSRINAEYQYQLIKDKYMKGDKWV